MSATVVIATASALIEIGLIGMLAGADKLEYRGSAHDSIGTALLLAREVPDILIVDQELASNLAFAPAAPSAPRVLVMSRRSHLGADVGRMPPGVCGAIPERAAAPQIALALRTIGDCHAARKTRDCRLCPLQGSMALPRLPLTKREYAIFLYIGQGWSNQKIANATDRSVKTIESHRESIKRKLGLESGSALIEAAFAWKRGDYQLGELPRHPLQVS